MSKTAVISFPTVLWGKTAATFLPAGTILPEEVPVTAAMAFAMQNEKFVLANIAGRGWCIPGGRLEAGETAEGAVRRETLEEIGATLGALTLLGTYLLDNDSTGEKRLVPTYRADVLTVENLPAGSESLGVRVMAFEEVAEEYFLWDALIEAVFRFAREFPRT